MGYKTNITIAQENFYLGETVYLLAPNIPPHAYLTRNNIIYNWNELLNRLRFKKRSFLQKLVGYVWKIEYGIDKGIHYHLILLFNGNKVQNDYYYADALGKLWLELTDNVGVYFNCSVDKKKRYGDNNCLQVIHRNDDRSNLYKMVSYLAKIDDNEEMARSLSHGRLFGKSN